MNKALQLTLCVLAIFAAQTMAGVYVGPYANHILGVPPADTPEVVHAKAAHIAAYNAAAVAAAIAPDYDAVYAPRYVGPLAPPPVLINGVPADTPEVVHAKIAHAHAYTSAAIAAAAAPEHAPYVYAAGAPIVPLDTPEVHAAKVAHFTAHAVAKGLLR